MARATVNTVRDPAALSGYTVGVTADRGDELVTLLTGRGARVVAAPPPRPVPVADARLRSATRACLAARPDVVLVDAGFGLRGWLAAADAWGLAAALRAALARAHLVARGPTARAALRQAGLRADFVAPGGAAAAVVTHLRERGLAGRTVAVPLPGEGRPGYVAALAAAGAAVLEVPVLYAPPPGEPAPLRRLADLVVGRLVDAVAFTAAPAVTALLHTAGAEREALLGALRAGVLPACAGPVTAAPLRASGVPVLLPATPQPGALARTLAAELPRRDVTLTVQGRRLVLRGHAAVFDGALRPLAPGPMAVLRALAACPGRVLSRAALRAALPRGADGHAVDMAVARVRAALGVPGVVETVVRRGYRIPG